MIRLRILWERNGLVVFWTSSSWAICRVKAIELGRDNSNIVFTFAFEYENGTEIKNVGNGNESKLAGYQKVIGNMSHDRNTKKQINNTDP
jgi:hypothetical protein